MLATICLIRNLALNDNIISDISFKLCRLFWTFYKMGVICYLFGIFVLQDYEKIVLFMKSMYFYGNVAPVVLVIVALLIKVVFPKSKQSAD